MDGQGVRILGFGIAGDPALRAILLALPMILGVFTLALQGPIWRARLRRWLYAGGWTVAYARALAALERRLEGFFGPPLSLRAAARCFLLAVVYALMFAILQATQMQTLLDVPRRPDLVALFALALASAVVSGAALRRFSPLVGGAALSAAILALLLGFDFAFLALPLERQADALFLLAPLAGIAAASALSADLRVALAVAATALLGIALFAAAGVVAVGAGAFATAAIGALAAVAALPALNAAFDLPSLAASRWLIGRLERDARLAHPAARAGALLAHAAVDIALACLCLFGLTAALAAILDAMRSEPFFEIYAAAADAPWQGMGLVMTVMLASTLLPTALHLFLAVFALAALRPPFAARVAFLAQEPEQGGEAAEPASRLLVALYLTAFAGAALMAIWAGAHGLLALVAAASGPEGGWHALFDLVDAALGLDVVRFDDVIVVPSDESPGPLDGPLLEDLENLPLPGLDDR